MKSTVKFYCPMCGKLLDIKSSKLENDGETRYTSTLCTVCDLKFNFYEDFATCIIKIDNKTF